MNAETSQSAYFDSLAPDWDRWKAKNRYYHRVQERLYQFLVEPGSSVLEVGCATGDLLASVKPSRGVGADISARMVDAARQKYPNLTFFQKSADDLAFPEKFSYVLMADLIGHLKDIQKALLSARAVMTPRSRLIITYYNFLWEPVVVLAERLRLKIPQPRQNWINTNDLTNLLDLADFEVIRTGQRLLIPKNIPLISWFFNTYVAQMPLFRKFCVTRYLVARPRELNQKKKYSVSVIIPERNEKGNIEKAVTQTPAMGKSTEIIFVEGHSKDGTLDEIKRVVKKYGTKRDVRYAVQSGVGKGDAVREGFRMAKGDILMILDGDLTVAPEDLPKFYEAIASNRGEFINGSRLVYPMEKEAMRLLNLFGNKFFSLMFTWLLGQRFKDTLCGTKVMFRSDYERLAKNRHYFGDFDPFGDFDLLFGAAKLNLKILEIPIRYRDRSYGTTNISRFRHGMLLLEMCLFAMNKLKFRP
ncbi:MAG TPA: bifunctional class I SAM-dependent methyltransferase/glycosyltransferase family 2 protein [Bacteroidota bacterium]